MSTITMTATEHEPESPFLVHTEGPDDVEPFGTWAEACMHAHDVNSSVVAYNARSLVPGLIRAWAIPYSRAAFYERYPIMKLTEKEQG